MEKAGREQLNPEEQKKDTHAELDKLMADTDKALHEKAESPLVLSRIEVALSDADKIVNFAKEHTSYKGNSSEWNAKFCVDILGMDKEKLDASTAMVYVMALQNFLNQNISNAFGTFKNKFTKVDGYLGSYTMSVLARYLNKKNEGNAEWKQLESSKSEVRAEEYKKALSHLNGLEFELKGVARSGADFQPDEPLEPLEAVDAEAKANEKSKVKKEKSPVIDSGSKAKAKKLTAALLDLPISRSLSYQDKLHTDQLEDLKRFKSADKIDESQDPEAFLFSTFQNDINKARPGSRPRRAFEAFKVAFRNLKEAKFSELDPESMKVYTEVQKAYDEALQNLRKSVDSYRKDSELINEKAKSEYEAEIARLYSEYELPAGADMGNVLRLSVNSEAPMLNMDQYRKVISQISFDQSIRAGVSTVDALLKPYMDTLTEYFDYDGSQPFATLQDLISNLKEDRAEAFKERYTMGKKAEALLHDFNQLIYLRNMRRFDQGRVDAARNFDARVKTWLKKADEQEGYEPVELSDE